MAKWEKLKEARPRKPPITNDQFVIDLFEIIDASGLTLKQLADKSKVHMQSMVLWRAGLKSPNFATTRRLLDALGYRIEIVKEDP